MEESVKPILISKNHPVGTHMKSLLLVLTPESSLFGGKSGADVFKVS